MDEIIVANKHFDGYLPSSGAELKHRYRYSYSCNDGVHHANQLTAGQMRFHLNWFHKIASYELQDVLGKAKVQADLASRHK